MMRGHDTNEDASAIWDAARTSLRATSWESLSLREAAERVGMTWPFMRGGDELGSFLALDWEKLRRLRGFGRVKVGKLLSIAQSASGRGMFATMPPDKVRPRNPVASVASVMHCLDARRIRFDAPICLVNVSNRVRHVLRREHVETLGQLVEWLAGNGDLSGIRGLGCRSLGELTAFQVALTSLAEDGLADFLPVAVEGQGLSLDAAVAHLLSRLGKGHIEFLRRRFALGQTLPQASAGLRITRARGAQIEDGFLKALKARIECFPSEWQGLWTAWERATPVVECLQHPRLSPERRVIAAGAIARLIAKSPEGKATIKHRKEQFRGWLSEIRRCQEFHSEGIKLQSFLKARGQDEVLGAMLAFLSKQPGIEVLAQGRVVCRKR